MSTTQKLHKEIKSKVEMMQATAQASQTRNNWGKNNQTWNHIQYTGIQEIVNRATLNQIDANYRSTSTKHELGFTIDY